jgi:hypothetical protein
MRLLQTRRRGRAGLSDTGAHFNQSQSRENFLRCIKNGAVWVSLAKSYDLFPLFVRRDARYVCKSAESNQ